MRILFVVLFIGSFTSYAQISRTVSFDLSFSDSVGDIQIDVFKFYISSIEFQFHDLSTFEEANSYHLINKDDTASQSITISNIPDKTIMAIAFTVGTDSIANVSGALDGDLDPILGMYWAWNSGYINFKIEGSKNNEPFEFHIGGYNGAQATARKFSYPINQNEPFVIHVNPSVFIDKIDLATNHSIIIPGALAVSLTEYYQFMLNVQ